jgi:hypothetical protein
VQVDITQAGKVIQSERAIATGTQRRFTRRLFVAEKWSDVPHWHTSR